MTARRDETPRSDPGGFSRLGSTFPRPGVSDPPYDALARPWAVF